MNDTQPPYSNYNLGLTLRDYFAAHAPLSLTVTNPDIEDDALAKLAYDWADAMLAEKAKREAQ